MKKSVIIALSLSMLIIALIVRENVLASSWDISGKIEDIVTDEESISLLVKTTGIFKQSDYYITVDKTTDIQCNGEYLSFSSAAEQIQTGFKIKATIGSTTLYSNPPVAKAKKVEVKGS